ncbi:apolipoprotein D-like [Centruroides vittatus]|uniref:apolipoprotein D-like n=1 Tax=Centruroides vittatus TaxID=120091 RepID=UPI0035100C8B
MRDSKKVYFKSITMEKIVSGFILILCLTSFVKCQSYFSSSCPSPAPMNDFNITAFTGKWYEVESTRSIFETFWNCPTTTISITGEGTEIERGGYISLLNRNFYNRIVHTKLNTPDTRRPGRLEFNFPGLTQPLKYVILDTDYDNYALTWSCYEFRRLGGTLGHFEYIWVLSRHVHTDKEVKQKLYTALDDNGIRRFYITKNRMDECHSKP